VKYALRQKKQILQLSVLGKVRADAEETDLTIECSQ